MRILKTLALAFVSFTVGAQNAPSIEGFMGSTWGMSTTQVKQTNAGKNYEYKDGLKGLVVMNEQFAGFTNCSLIWSFTESDKLFQGKVLTSTDLDAQSMDLYDRIADAISRKYGQGARLERYDYPYEKGDGHWITAFSLGKGHLLTYWKDENENVITMELNEDFFIIITYQSSELIEVAIAEQNRENDTDL